MHWEATSRDSWSSGETVPSLVQFVRKSMIARARRFFDSVAWGGGGGGVKLAFVLFGRLEHGEG